MTFKQALKELRINLTDLVIWSDGGSGDLKCEFDISPKEFLKFAKEDFHSKSKKGLINSLTNSKRAIDCQTDLTLKKLGIDSFNLPKELEPFIELCKFESDMPYKLKVIQSLDLAPGYIISKARTLRNKLEHYYETPSEIDVQESLDIAELFIRSIEGKTRILDSDFGITDRKKCNSISIHFNEDEQLFRFNTKNSSLKEIPNFIIKNNCPEYFAFLRLMNTIDDQYECEHSFKLIAQLIGLEIPIDRIKLDIDY